MREKGIQQPVLIKPGEGESESDRRSPSIFRTSVLTAYEGLCTLCDEALPFAVLVINVDG